LASLFLREVIAQQRALGQPWPIRNPYTRRCARRKLNETVVPVELPMDVQACSSWLNSKLSEENATFWPRVHERAVGAVGER